jgi:albonoursin synthase
VVSAQTNPVLDAMRRRRVTREFLDEPVSVADLRTILLAARLASTAGARQIRRFLVLRDPARIERLRPFAPGILLGVPPALIVLATDRKAAAEQNVQVDRDPSVQVDVGTALAHMMLAAESLGLGSCPATSFSQSAVAEMLGFPESLVPELMLQVGRPAPKPPGAKRSHGGPTIAELTDWEELGQREPPEDAAASSGV